MTAGDSLPLRISIVIPNLNSGPTLERALVSLLDQNYSDLELIVADGGSTDESAEVLRKYQHRITKILSEPDHGQADALNRGFRHATGDVFGWLCADDELMPGALGYVAELFSMHSDRHIVAGACERVFDDQMSLYTPVRQDAWEAIYVQNTFDQPSVFWRAEWHRRAGELDTRLHLAFDWEFWCRLKRSGARVAITARKLARYHFSNDNKTSRESVRHVEEGSLILRRYAPLFRDRLYRFIYREFDLHGCLDQPPAASAPRMWSFRLLAIAARSAVANYPWHFASLQQRGLRWYSDQPLKALLPRASVDTLPLVSIITPVFDDTPGMETTAESVSAQGYPAIEHVVIGGRAGSRAVRGLSHAMNCGIRAARGEFIAFLGCGDMLLPGAVRRAAEELSSSPWLPAVYGEMKGGAALSGPFDRARLISNPEAIHAPAFFFRKTIFNELGYFDEGLDQMTMWDMLIRIAKRHDLGYVPNYIAARDDGARAPFDQAVQRLREIGRLTRRHTHTRYTRAYVFAALTLSRRVSAK
jgi:glycosyltransferase involved in cell wall biosynthesis